MAPYGARHQPVFGLFPVVEAVFPLPFSAVFHKIGEHRISQGLTVFVQFIYIICVVRDECTWCSVAVPVDVSVSAASAAGDAAPARHAAIPEISRAGPLFPRQFYPFLVQLKPHLGINHQVKLVFASSDGHQLKFPHITGALLLEVEIMKFVCWQCAYVPTCCSYGNAERNTCLPAAF